MTSEAEGSKKRPLWLMFPGVGVHRAHAGVGLMEIPVFKVTVERAAVALQPYDVDLIWVLTEAPESAFEDVVNVMVSITTVQMALVEVMRAIGLHPDGFFGSSLGELSAGYVDNTLTLEQTILAAYWIARCFKEAKVPTGSNIFVRLSSDECKSLCPPDCEISVHCSQKSVIVSGPVTTIKGFMTNLSSQGVEVKILSQTLRYHSKYVETVAPALQRLLKETMLKPKPRSSRWISTRLHHVGDEEVGKLCSAEYITDVMRVPVDKITPMRVMPDNAVLVEVSAFAKLAGYMKEYLPAFVTPVELIRKDAPDPVAHLFEAIKKIYELREEPPPVDKLSAVFCCHPAK